MLEYLIDNHSVRIFKLTFSVHKHPRKFRSSKRGNHQRHRHLYGIRESLNI